MIIKSDIMKRNIFLILSIAATIGIPRLASAQYPTVPDDVK